MSRHPAPEELLLDYAAGALAQGPALAVALHVALDPSARRMVEQLGALGGALVEDETEAPIDEAALQSVLARLEQVAVEPRPAPPLRPPVARPGFEWAPAALVPHIRADARWRRIMGGFDEIRLSGRGDDYRVSLLRLAPGRSLPAHRHVGDEYTVVLQGGYTDTT